ncbi:MAG: DUF3667 domain-containing protein [Luteimonas sp.]
MNTPASSVAPTAALPACQNCGEPLLGPHCYRCGQPVNGLVRHFSSILGDFLDSVLNIDARIFRTLGPLFTKPAYLSLEYFAGRRVRYVSPVRLFVFLSIVTFFVAQLMLTLGDGAINFGNDDSAIARATTVAEVERLRDVGLKGLTGARESIPVNVPGARAGIDAGATAIRQKAQRRIDALRTASAAGKPVPMPTENEPAIEFNNSGPWDPRTNPIRLDWAPAFANDWINAQVGRAKKNIARMKNEPDLIKDAALSALPSTLFVLLPLVALLLKVLYVFKRRMYMEHLIVALHSHAFLCGSLLLVFATMAIRNALPAVSGLMRTLEVLLFAWMPLYLLLMQKRVYAQGWTLTLLKYCVLGFCYVILLSIGVALTVLGSLVWA